MNAYKCASHNCNEAWLSDYNPNGNSWKGLCYNTINNTCVSIYYANHFLINGSLCKICHRYYCKQRINIQSGKNCSICYNFYCVEHLISQERKFYCVCCIIRYDICIISDNND